METKVILDETLRYIGGSSRKFYRVVVTEELAEVGGLTKYVVTRKWGRIGSLGQSKTEFCFTRVSAMNKARDILNGKKARGYGVYKTITDDIEAGLRVCRYCGQDGVPVYPATRNCEAEGFVLCILKPPTKLDRKGAEPVEDRGSRCEALDENAVQCAGYIIVSGADKGRCDNCGVKPPGSAPSAYAAEPVTFADEFQQFAKGD